MAPKRRISSVNDEVKAAKMPKKKSPTTLKDRILAIVADADVLLGAPTIKKRLIADYGMEESKAFNTNVKKALNALVAEEHPNFGKIGGSYHAGEESAAYKEHTEKQRVAAELRSHQDRGEIKCPYCEFWCGDECFVREDSVARGGLHKCSSCGKQFWSWISDQYLFGHKVEYRYGAGAVDYADYND